MVLVNHSISPDFDPAITQTVGSFIGGVVPVFISIGTVLLVYITFESNREEFHKINEANTFQQFNATFDSMYNTFHEIVVTKMDNATRNEFKDGFLGYIQQPMFDKQQEDKSPMSTFYENRRVVCYNVIFKEFELDKDILARSFEYKCNQILRDSIESFASALLLILEYLDLMFSKESTIGENRKFYLFRIFDVIKQNNLQDVIMAICFRDEKLKDKVLKFNLLRNCTKEIDFKYFVYVNKDGAGAIEYIYKFPIFKYFVGNEFPLMNNESDYEIF
jgi:hypothetical protein